MAGTNFLLSAIRCKESASSVFFVADSFSVARASAAHGNEPPLLSPSSASSRPASINCGPERRGTGSAEPRQPPEGRRRGATHARNAGPAAAITRMEAQRLLPRSRQRPFRRVASGAVALGGGDISNSKRTVETPEHARASKLGCCLRCARAPGMPAIRPGLAFRT